MTDPRPPAMTSLMADPSRCRVFAEDIAIHWYPDDLALERCWCGALERPIEAEEKR